MSIRFLGAGLSRRNSLEANQVQLNLGVAMRLRPDVEGCGCDFIDKRNCQPEAREVYTFDISLASIASLNSEVVITLCMKIS